LPLIPLSPLFQLSREYKKVVAQTKETLLFDCHSTGKEGQEQGQLLERDILEKRLAKATEKLDRLSTTLPSIQRSFLNDFNIYDVAKEIAHINSSLFRLVSLTTVDTNPLLDFHHYLSNAFAHQIIIETGASSSSTPTTTTSRNSTRKRKYCIIAHFIHIASILLSIYRDFSGCMAILACLQMPEIQRLHPLWAACPSKFTQSYKEMVKMLSPDNDYQTYYEQLKLHTLRFMIPNDTNTSPMIAVPFIQAHLSIIQKLIQQHAFVSPKTALSQSNHPHSNQHPVVLLSMCSDLNLIRSNANIYHWLVSRAYLTKQQLNMESVLIQPLGSAEMLPSPHLDEEEEEKALLQHWHLFRWSLYQKHYQQLQQQQRQQQEEEDEIKELDVSKPLSTMDSHVQGGQASSRTASSTVAVDDPCQEEADTRIKVKDRESLLQETNSNNNKIEKEEQIGNTTWSQTNRSKAHQTMAFSTAVDKNRCNGLPRQGSEEMTKHTIVDDEDEDSHTIIILAENDKEDWTGYASHHAHGTLEYKTSSTESTYPVDGKVTVEEEEDEEEEWTGYPVDVASQEEDDEDEIWRGYPIASDDEED
ncbi:ras guanine nucleotide exchange factor domain-containing protein, partial [Mycotypha africana]|uniref:ras guanine nucleotide exchange factor domain-containing protein n=1 Tax=Mycotypha africana TaxID=64632 RepID=UPI0023009AE8